MAETERTTQRPTRVVRETRIGKPEAEDVRNINVVDPRNVVVSTNLGKAGSTHAASARQSVRIRQSGGETYQETETVEERL
jgi:hypothetical protein